MAITIAPALIAAGTQYRKDLLTMPVAVLADALQFMSLRTGIQGKIIGGLLDTDAELRPYRTAKDASDATTITPYEWETFLGDVVKEFDPNAILGTLYTEITSKKPTEREIARLVALEMSKKVGKSLFNYMFTAVRNGAGNGTADLFNGFSTQIAAAVTAGTLSVAKNNYLDISPTGTNTGVTAVNAVDVLKNAFRGCDPILQNQSVNMYLPKSVKYLYEDAYQAEYGSAAFNTEFGQRKLIGSDDQCTFVPLSNMEAQNYIIITTKDNMLVGVDQESDKENVRIRECDNPKLVQFFMMAYFGVGFDNLDPRFIKVIKFK